MPRLLFVFALCISAAMSLFCPSLGARTPIALGAYFHDAGLCAPGDEAATRAFAMRVGRLPRVWMIFQSWTGWNQFPASQARRAAQLGATLCVTWEPWSFNRFDSRWSCRSVASGGYDNYVRQYARAVRQARVPVLIRFAHEMNGNWYPWATAYEGNFRRSGGNSPAEYVAMWKRVVSIFRQEGALNARWVWAPNIHYLDRFNSIQTQNADLRALYPGDEWVDWIGLSVYNDAARRGWQAFPVLFDGAYRVLTRLTNKPLMIAEIGISDGAAPRGQSKARWIEQTFLSDIPNRYGRVRLVCYFSRDKRGEGEANYRFDSSPEALRAFRMVALSPLYAG